MRYMLIGATVSALAALGVGIAAPASAGCETQAFAQYCDGPIRPDGTFDRCQTAFGQTYPYIPTTHRCYPVDPSQPWPMFPLGQPQHHIYP